MQTCIIILTCFSFSFSILRFLWCCFLSFFGSFLITFTHILYLINTGYLLVLILLLIIFNYIIFNLWSYLIISFLIYLHNKIRIDLSYLFFNYFYFRIILFNFETMLIGWTTKSRQLYWFLIKKSQYNFSVYCINFFWFFRLGLEWIFKG